MSVINDGGPAFARPQSRDPESYGYPETYPAQEGMTLRDYFAAKALAGFCAAPDDRVINGGTAEEIEEKRRIWARNDAQGAYRLADAMLAERSRREAQP